MSVVEVRRACRAYARGVHRHPARPVPAPRRRRRLGPPLHDDGLRLRGRDRAGLRRLLREGSRLPALKSVRWCFTDRTALAEAELEYEERTDPAIYVAFPAQRQLAGSPRADAASPDLDDDPVDDPVQRRDRGPSRRDLRARSRPTGASSSSPRSWRQTWRRPPAGSTGNGCDACSGAELAGAVLRPPAACRVARELTPRTTRARSASSWPTTSRWTPARASSTRPRATAKTTSSTGQREGLPILSPVDEAGRYHDGREVHRARTSSTPTREIVEDLKAAGALVALDPNFRHSYPHCWRCKKPVIFRATEQWFVRLTTRRRTCAQRPLDAIDARALDRRPGAQARIDGMVENRPDWCITRQRRWGLPITLLYAMQRRRTRRCLSLERFARRAGEFFDHVAAIFRDGGSRRLVRAARRGLPARRAPTCAASRGRLPGRDRHPRRLVRLGRLAHGRAALGTMAGAGAPTGGRPADLYLEGPDQHRGWFQSSLLTAVALTATRRTTPCSRTGSSWTSRAGRCRSRSATSSAAGRSSRSTAPTSCGSGSPAWTTATTSASPRRSWSAARGLPEDPQHGALPVSQPLRLRPAMPTAVPLANACEPLDRWALGQPAGPSTDRRGLRDASSSIVVYHQLRELLRVDLSAFYLDILKDRLYASAAGGARAPLGADGAEPDRTSAGPRCWRRSSPFTAEEIWAAAAGKEGRIGPPRAFRRAGRRYH